MLDEKKSVHKSVHAEHQDKSNLRANKQVAGSKNTHENTVQLSSTVTATSVCSSMSYKNPSVCTASYCSYSSATGICSSKCSSNTASTSCLTNGQCQWNSLTATTNPSDGSASYCAEITTASCDTFGDINSCSYNPRCFWYDHNSKCLSNCPTFSNVMACNKKSYCTFMAINDYLGAALTYCIDK